MYYHCIVFLTLMILQDTQCYKVLDVVSDFTNDQIAKRAKSIRSLIFYYIFHVKPQRPPQFAPVSYIKKNNNHIFVKGYITLIQILFYLYYITIL
jgi:hypothetical protein